MHEQENSSDNQNVALHDWMNESLLFESIMYIIIFFVKQIWYDFKSQSHFCEIIFLLWNCPTPKTAYTCSGNQPVVYA